MSRIERWLRAKRWTVALLVPLVGVLGHALSRALGEGPWSAALGWPPLVILANGVMALPLVVGLRGIAGRRGVVALALAALFSWIIEGVGVATGWPYGRFAYAVGLEPLLFDLVPIALPLFWVPMVINAWLLAIRVEMRLAEIRSPRLDPRPLDSGSRVALRIASAVLLLVLLDAIMDPGAVALGFWGWVEPGPWYGVPLVNFGGWLLSGAVGVGVIAWGFPADRVRRRLSEDGLAWGTLIAFTAFWGPINALHGQWAPVLLALSVAALVFRDFTVPKGLHAAQKRSNGRQ